MVEALLDLPPAGVFAALALFYGAIAAFIVWLDFHSPLRKAIHRLQGVVGPFTASVSVLFALLTGFLAADVGERNRQAVYAVTAEREAALTLHALSEAATTETETVRAALRHYLAAAVSDEWPRMAENRESARTDGALAGLVRAAADPAVLRATGPSVAGAMVEAVTRLARARSTRLSLSADRTNDLKWLTVLALGVISQISLALVHLERRPAQSAALALFSIAVVIALWLIALQENPFDGPIQVSPAPLQKALSMIEAAPSQ
ncbi:MAG TPA: hypothetical protein VFQ27_10040 [Xanthobacteraceae bacterium]|nr:hypothetical protein [Xanthobacteraceae bacterium]